MTRNDFDPVGKLVKQDASTLLEKSEVIDCSGRHFKKISAFEYAAWALDEDIWLKILDSIPDEKKTEICEKFLE